MGEKKDKDEEENCIIAEREMIFFRKKSYSNAETNVNKRIKYRQV